MKALPNRSRLVSFRLTEHEYEIVKQFCLATGVPSVSELTREVLLQEITAKRRHSGVASEDLVILIRGLDQVGKVLREISVRIAHVLEPQSEPV